MLRRLLLTSALVLAAAVPAVAQTYPSRPIKLVVGFTPGGGVDINARDGDGETPLANACKAPVWMAAVIDRLLKAGERVFAESGFWQAHVADIAKRAGCSVGSFYRRFQDKEAFFFALQADMAAHAEANIAKFFADPACRTEPLIAVFHRLARNSALALVAAGCSKGTDTATVGDEATPTTAMPIMSSSSINQPR